jgi:hypothetical protein
LGIAGTDGDLLHVHVGRVEQRPAFGHGHRRDCARHVLGAERGAFERINGDVDPGPVLVADRFADEQHGRFVALALPDHDRAVDGKLVELAPHGVDRGLIGCLLVATAGQSRRRHRRPLGHPHELERENALQCQVRLYGDRRHGLASLFVHVLTLAPHCCVVVPRPSIDTGR